MKTIFKVITFVLKTTSLFSLALISLTTSGYRDAEDNAARTVKEKIENSVVQIKTHANRRGMGSGTYIRIKQIDYVLTNAHICLAGELESASSDNLTRANFKYDIYSQKSETQIFVSTEDLIYDIQEDWCLIPLYRQVTFPIIDHTFLGEAMTKSVRFITFNSRHQLSPEEEAMISALRPRLKTEVKKQFTFKGCSDNNDYFELTSRCLRPSTKYFNAKSSYLANDLSTEKQIIINEVYAYHLPVVGGDSGSPVFNERNQLVGLITSRSTIPYLVFGHKIFETPMGSVTPMAKFKLGAR